MKPDLRDWFAAHVAAALAAEQRMGAATLAARAYDVAEALVAERAARLDAELAEAHDPDGSVETFAAGGLLDEAMPFDERDDDAEPAWLEPLPPASARPGLARTQLELPIDERRRKTGA